MSWGYPLHPYLTEAKPFLLRIDENGNEIAFKLLETSERHLSTSEADSYTILRMDNGDYIMALVSRKLEAVCNDCISSTPILLRTTGDFDSIVWMKRFLDVPASLDNRYNIKSIDITNDSTEVVVGGWRYSPTGMGQINSSFLFKANLNGDSLWMRHFIPLNWDSTRATSVRLEDVKIAADDGIIFVGRVGDSESNKTRPWIVKVDNNGCLIPGCLNSTAIGSSNEKDSDLFYISPNPANDLLYIQTNLDRAEEVNLNLINISGQLVKSIKFIANKGGQYVVDLEEIPKGIYVLQFHLEDLYEVKELIVH
jgi:hypothetical protein